MVIRGHAPLPARSTVAANDSAATLRTREHVQGRIPVNPWYLPRNIYILPNASNIYTLFLAALNWRSRRNYADFVRRIYELPFPQLRRKLDLLSNFYISNLEIKLLLLHRIQLHRALLWIKNREINKIWKGNWIVSYIHFISIFKLISIFLFFSEYNKLKKIMTD